MPPRAKRGCRSPMCPRTTQEAHGYCADHAHLASGWNKPGRGTAEQRGYGAEWRKIRAAVLRRDRFLCQCPDCKGRRLPATEVDHIISKAQGGTDEMSNLQAINVDCHARKTHAERVAGLRASIGEPRRN